MKNSPTLSSWNNPRFADKAAPRDTKASSVGYNIQHVGVNADNVPLSPIFEMQNMKMLIFLNLYPKQQQWILMIPLLPQPEQQLTKIIYLLPEHQQIKMIHLLPEQ